MALVAHPKDVCGIGMVNKRSFWFRKFDSVKQGLKTNPSF